MASTTPVVRVGVGVFIINPSQSTAQDPSFLMGKRSGSHGAGTYALPGGHLEFGETPEECAAREVMEETGLDITDLQFLTATNDYMPKDNKHYITMFMVAKRRNENDQAQILEPEKCEGWEWVKWSDMVAWVKKEVEATDDEVLEKRLFIPMLNLVKQRGDVVPALR